MKSNQSILITETSRDALQVWKHYIHSETKAKYINVLLKAGFDILDCGSFVSPKAVPQMADTSEVLSLLETGNSATKLMVLAGNTRGGKQAATENKIHTIAFPYSVSATFLKRNLNTTPEDAWQTVLDLKRICEESQKELRVYVTMAFGNPYGDAWNDEIVMHEIKKLYAEGIRNIVFSDITGEGRPGTIERVTSEWITTFPEASLGIHLHTKPSEWQDKVEAAWRGGMRNFESAIGGFGGCPMTGYELLGNLNTLNLVDWCARNGIETGIYSEILLEAAAVTRQIFK